MKMVKYNASQGVELSECSLKKVNAIINLQEEPNGNKRHEVTIKIWFSSRQSQLANQLIRFWIALFITQKLIDLGCKNKTQPLWSKNDRRTCTTSVIENFIRNSNDMVKISNATRCAQGSRATISVDC